MSMRSAGAAGPSFVPAAVEEGLRTLAARLVAGLIALLSCAVWLSLASWSVHDLARETANSEPLRNLLGMFGARLSDLLLQSLGAGAVLIVVAPLFWAAELWSARRVNRLFRKLLAWPLAAIFISAALAVVPPFAMWPLHQGLGGLLGDMLFGLVSQLMAAIHPVLGWPLALVTFVGIGGIVLLQALGLRLGDLALLAGPVDGRLDDEQPLMAYAGQTAANSTVDDRHFPSLPENAPWQENVSWQSEAQHQQALFAEPPPVAAPHSTERPERLGERLRQAAASWRVGPAAQRTPAEHGFAPQHETAELPVDHESRRIAERFAPGAPPRRGVAAKPRPGPGRANAAPTSIQAAPGQSGSNRAPTAPEMAGFRQSPNSSYRRPSLRLLKEPPSGNSAKGEFNQNVLRGNSRLLEDVLADFGVKGKIINVRPGPIVTLFELEPARGVKAARVIGLAEDIARSMSAVSARVSIVPGRNVLGIELPNMQRETVHLRDLLSAPAFLNSAATLPMALGKSIEGEPIIVDLARMPHLLIAGTTGSGKSVGINAMILSLLYRHAPEDCRLILIDPKMLEFMPYNNIPHLLTPVVTEPAKAVAALDWAVREMEERYKRMAALGVRNIGVFNNQIRNAQRLGKPIIRTIQTGFDAETGQPIQERQELKLETMPYIVIVIDEMADLMLTAGKEIEASVQRLAQMARAAGIHLITATQRPSVDVITGTIKANLPSRVSYKVTSKIDSRTILGDSGAEHLLGSGDLIYSIDNGRMLRAHGPFVSEDEVEEVTRFLISQGRPAYVDGVTDSANSAEAAGPGGDDAGAEDLFDKAVAIMLRDQKVSTSYIQRRLSIGYNRAADIVERMEREGLVSAPDRTGRRQILIGTLA